MRALRICSSTAVWSPGSIGRLCLAIFGAREQEQAHRLADDLGVALQLTNILRDLREDATLGRVYMPGEDLRRYQVSDDGRFDGEEGQLDALTRFQARRAGEWFDRGLGARAAAGSAQWRLRACDGQHL